MARVTVLGLGAMGSRMAVGLMAAGHQLTVWNRTATAGEALRAQGANLAATPAVAVAEAEFVLSMVRDDAASRAVWLEPASGALPALPASAVAVECSTLTVAWVRELAQHAEARGARLITAPLAGSRPQADQRQLLFFAGGAAEVIATATPVLQALGLVHPLGSAAAASAFKLAVNALLAAQIAQLGELLALLKANGVDAARAVDVLGQTPVCSPSLRGAAAGVLAGLASGHFPPAFPIELVAKDLGYALSAALPGRAPITAAARQLFDHALALDKGAQNITAVASLYPASPSNGETRP